jgi:hypothetical protein
MKDSHPIRAAAIASVIFDFQRPLNNSESAAIQLRG